MEYQEPIYAQHWLSCRNHDIMHVYQAKLEDLEEDAIYKFLKIQKTEKENSNFVELLLANNLATLKDGFVYPTVAGVLLFSKQTRKCMPDTKIICMQFKGQKRIMGLQSCEGTLIEQFNESLKFIVSKLDQSYVTPFSKKEKNLEVPEVAIREALLNAIIHRNYDIEEPIKISIYKDRIEIISPGAFLYPMVMNMASVGPAYIRNSVIVRFFRALGYVTAFGFGISTIFRSFTEWELKQPQIIELENCILCILPRPLKKILTK